MDVADRQIFRGAGFRRRQRGDRRKDNIPFLEERAEVARGGEDRCLMAGPKLPYTVRSENAQQAGLRRRVAFGQHSLEKLMTCSFRHCAGTS